MNLNINTAQFTEDRKHRLALVRQVHPIVPGAVLTYLYIGVNPSDAGETTNDQTATKLMEFTRLNGGDRMIVANLFTHVASDVRELAKQSQPICPGADKWLGWLMQHADVVVPMWGSRNKLPKALRPRIEFVEMLLTQLRKPVKCFGITASGDPTHPLMLKYATPLVDFWESRRDR